ncbi:MULTISPECIES: hypothetical protein [Streptomyces]|uniref:DUF3885 domain-containing protein n=1 Tax=Streptomyces TaxID=1883 RepID=UPI001E35742D|nr:MULTISPECIES: hypothetical protein [Streptomyces]MCZ4100419.1 hypothetical protein [Streptomyces sp. H39-C1]
MADPLPPGADVGFDSEALSALWRERRPLGPPVAHRLRSVYNDRWVRFHSLPGGKRYPENEHEYTTVLDRYNTVLDGLFVGRDVYVVTTAWSVPPAEAEHPATRRDADHGASRWTTLTDAEDPDLDSDVHTHLYVSRRPWQSGCIDTLLRHVADDELAGVLVTDTDLRRIHHPYDGGADVILATPQERDALRDEHRNWLSSHPSGC